MEQIAAERSRFPRLNRLIELKPSLGRNVVWNWANTVATILFTLLITPAIIRSLGAEKYGLWSFLNGFLAYTDLLYLGLGASLVRYVAEYAARGESTRLTRLVSVVWTIYLIIGLCALLVSMGLGWYLPGGRTAGGVRATAVQWTCVLLGLRLLMLFIASVYSGLLTGINRLDVAMSIRFGFTLSRIATVPFALNVAEPLLGLAAIVAVSALAETLVLQRTAKRFLPSIPRHFVWPTVEELKFLYGFGFKSFFVLLAVKIISYTDTTVIGVMLGPAAVALYVLPLQLVEYGRIAIGGITMALLPDLAASRAREAFDQLKQTYLEASQLTCLVSVFLNVTVVALGSAFLSRWVGDAYGRAAFPILLCLGGASIVQAITSQVAMPLFQATDSLGIPSLVLSIEGLLNVALSVWLARRIGITGVAIATIIPSVALTLIWLPIYSCRMLRLPLTSWLRITVLPGAILLLLLAALHLALHRIWPASSYLALIAKAAAGGVIAAGFIGTVYRSRRGGAFAVAGEALASI